METIEGNKDLWEGADMITCVETWETQETMGLEIPRFTRVVSVCNDKRSKKGRGFGGIIVWIRVGIGWRSSFSQALTEQLRHGVETTGLSQVITCMALKIFGKTRKSNKTWYDDKCAEARQKAMKYDVILNWRPSKITGNTLVLRS
ncbi:hypothetical protein R1sor_010480 [Riccia sorocarpa]|uniref:Uncharacterized protein n=1 Tax=Riccia sorocarpa TaxID=122646 RepID=A0ABD3I1K6_9MARC